MLRTRSLLCVLLCLACGSPNAPKAKLEGSLTTVMDLGYDEAALDFTGTEFTVSFRRKRGMGFDTVLQVGSRLEQAPFPDGGTDSLRAQAYDLTEVLTSGLPRALISRQVLDDPRTTFPPLRVGEIRFNNIPMQGSSYNAVGDFHLTFENGVEFASGKTVFSGFQAKFQ